MFVIISGAPSTRTTQSIDLATGPFETEEAATEFRDLLDRTVDGRHTIVNLYQPKDESSWRS